MKPPNMARMLLWSTAIMAVVCSILLVLLRGDEYKDQRLFIVVAVGGMWCSFALVTMLVHIFLHKPWEEREKHMAMLSAQNEVYREIVNVTRKVGHAATQAANVERAMQASVETLKEELKLDGCSLRMLDAGKEQLVSVAGVGYRDPNYKPVPLSSKEGVAGKAIAERRAIFVEDTAQERDFVKSATTSAPIQSLFCVPLLEQGNVVGVLSGSSRTPRKFSEHEREILEMISNRLSSLLWQYKSLQPQA
jgi:putative methionine-R-sulfoxide reductase with GAF domain